MRKISFILFAFALFSCREFNEKDFIGSWKSDDGSILQIYKDGTFKVTNLPEWILFHDYSSKKLYSGTGAWEMVSFKENRVINLGFPKSVRIQCNFNVELNYEKEFRLNAGYWTLYFYDGNKDEKYFFHIIYP